MTGAAAVCSRPLSDPSFGQLARHLLASAEVKRETKKAEMPDMVSKRSTTHFGRGRASS